MQAPASSRRDCDLSGVNYGTGCRYLAQGRGDAEFCFACIELGGPASLREVTLLRFRREYADSGKNRDSSVCLDTTSSPRRSMSIGLWSRSEPKQTTGSPRLKDSAARTIHKFTGQDTSLSKPDQEIESRVHHEMTTADDGPGKD